MTTTSAAVPHLSPERLRVEIYNALVHCIVSNNALWATVDVAEVKETMADAIACCPEGPLCLEPLWHYMLAKQTPRDAARQSIFLFHSRAPRFGITMVLPPDLEDVPDAERAAAVDALRSVGGTTGTFVGRAPAAPPPSMLAALASSPAPEPPRRSSSAAAAAGAKAGGKPLAALGRVAAMIAVGCFIYFAFVHADSSAKVEAALDRYCEHVEVHGRAALCTANARARENHDDAARKADLVATALGVEVVFVDEAGEVLDFAH